MTEISFNDFSRIDLRVGEILSAEEHPNANKLFVLKVDLNEGKPRVIVAGLREHYTKEKLIGKRAVFVANLKPILLRGVESQGMILAAVSDDKRKVEILEVSKEIRVGTKIS